MRLKLYGERHTNTNYLQQLLSLNLDCEWVEGVVPTWRRSIERFGISGARDRYFARTRSKNLGWKHTAVDPTDDLNGVRAITLTKNPYAWVVSMHRRPYHLENATGLSIDEFVRQKWQTLGRDNLNREAITVAELWNRKNASYFYLSDERSMHLTSEEVQLSPQETVSKVAEFMEQQPAEEFRDVERSTKKRPDKNSDYYRDYYGRELWRDSLSLGALEALNKELDQSLMAKFGYEVIHDLSVDNSGD